VADIARVESLPVRRLMGSSHVKLRRESDRASVIAAPEVDQVICGLESDWRIKRHNQGAK